MMADYSLLGQYKGFGGALKAAQDEALANQIQQVKLAQLASGSDLPAAVQEYNYYNKLDPQSQQKYLQMKRADKIIDTGGGFSRFDPITGAALPINMGAGNAASPLIKTLPPAQQPQNIEEEERTKLRTKKLIEAEENLPILEAKVGYTSRLINDLVNDPALPRAVGTVSSKLFNVRGSTADFENKVKQLGGGAFLEAYGQLKGGGAISEAEGAKAEQAIARMQLSASEEGFKSALLEFQQIVQNGLAREKERIKELRSQSYNAPTTPVISIPDIGREENIDAILSGLQPKSASIPKMGTVEDGYMFLGGNPADPKRWKKK